MQYDFQIEELGIKNKCVWLKNIAIQIEVMGCYTDVLDLFLGKNTESEKGARPYSKLDMMC